MMLLPLLFACTDPGKTDDTAGVDNDTAADDSGDTGVVKPPDIVLGDPYVAIVAATTNGSLASTCELDMTLTNVVDGSTAATLALRARGRDWSGASLTGGVQYKAEFSAIACNNGDDKYFESGTFSGQEGILFVLWYTGVNIGYDALEQGSEGGDFVGGEATLVVRNSYPDGNVQSVAAGIGPITATLESSAADGNTYKLSWDDEENVAYVLSQFTEQLGEDYVSGSPAWLEKPSWW